MRARAYCTHPSIRDHWALRYMSRCPDQVVSLKRDPQCLSTQARLGESTLSSPRIEPGPVVWKRDTLPLARWAFRPVYQPIIIYEGESENKFPLSTGVRVEYESQSIK
ncbi:hypothetical protein TNCV_183641 [Trichonephila clavipes]|nr:hypothetical protein TNCV_183641 [Trichonephila clavipes]